MAGRLLNVTPRDENMKSSIRAKPDTAVTKGGGFGADLHHGNLPPKKKTGLTKGQW